MVQSVASVFKQFFYKMEPSRDAIFRSGGLALIHCWLISTDYFESLHCKKIDRRKARKIKYRISEIIPFIILHILDGDKRISHYDRNPNKALFLKLFKWNKTPSQSTVLKTLQRNPALSRVLNHFLLRSCVDDIIRFCNKNKLKKITIDVDQTAREIHGKQQGVEKGYSAGKRNSNLYQIRVYAVREMKQTLRVRLMSGNTHSSFHFLSEVRLIAKMLKKSGITGVFVGDSGFEVGAVCDYLHENNHEFIFAVPKRKEVKRRGKYSKNKKQHDSGKIQIKERKRPATNKFRHEYREIYVQVLSSDGQAWFDFVADYFTNVFVTNMTCSALKVYRSYKKHAVIETIIEELKNDFGAGLAHGDDFKLNSMMTTCSGIAYNIKNRFLIESGLTQQDGVKIKLSTFQNMWLHTPGEIIKRSNRFILKIAPNRFEQYNKILAA